jgi:UDPglucose 6-dehydrogenase
MDNARRDYETLAYAPSALDACAGADVVLLLTEWQEFKDMVPSELAAVVRQRAIVDGRNALDRDLWRAEGWHYRALGRT